MSVDIDHLRGWIGREAEAVDLITPRLAAEFRATFAPQLADVGEEDAPLAIHWCLSPAIVPAAEIGPDGHPERGGFLPPVPLPRRMWAGGAVEIHEPLRIGDSVTRRSTIEDVSLKEGRSGALCFVAVRHEYLTARGLAVSERHDIVYREAETAKLSPAPHAEVLDQRSSLEARGTDVRPRIGSGAGSSTPAARAPQDEDGGNVARHADLTWSVEANPVLLFRYSALTFNGHRIHYDLPYVTGEEGYAGLVVHGPIQATLLLNAAAALGSRSPRRFRYRGLSPLIAGGRFAVSAARGPDGGIACWTRSADGRTCMEAEASASD